MDSGFAKRAIMRMDNYDYTQAGPYFLTICLYNKQQLLGRITGQSGLTHTPAGRMIHQVWMNMPRYNPGLVLDEFIVMPDHFHAIIGFVDPKIWRAHWPATTDCEVDSLESLDAKQLHVSDIVRRFKNQTIKQYKKGVEQEGWPPYSRQLWQRGFWDRIIRNERDLQNHREYIYNNVAAKHLDQFKQDPQVQQKSQ